VKSAGNACSLVRGSSLDADMLGVVDMWFGSGRYSQASLRVYVCVRQDIDDYCLFCDLICWHGKVRNNSTWLSLYLSWLTALQLRIHNRLQGSLLGEAGFECLHDGESV
jgi:hypothetical protein